MRHKSIERIEKRFIRSDIPVIRSGDTVRVHSRIIEGDKERIQVFEGVVIRANGGSNRATFTVRKVSYGIGVERVFPLHSPRIDKIEVVRSGRVRRARLYYLRDRTGKAARLRARTVGDRTRAAVELEVEQAEPSEPTEAKAEEPVEDTGEERPSEA